MQQLMQQLNCTRLFFLDWFRATQAMICIGLILLILAVVLISVYMCVHSISKNTVIMALIIVCFSGGQYIMGYYAVIVLEIIIFSNCIHVTTG